MENPYSYQNNRYSVAGYDLTHVLSVNVVYELPVGKGKPLATHNSVVDYIIGGWQVNTIAQAHSGLPYSISADGDIANTGDTGYERANIVGNPGIATPSQKEWFNTAAFAIPATYTYGDSGRNILRGPAELEPGRVVIPESFPFKLKPRLSSSAPRRSICRTRSFSTSLGTISASRISA